MWATTHNGHLHETSFHPAYHLNTYSTVVGIPYRELTHSIQWKTFTPISLSFLQQPIGDGVQTKDSQLQHAKAGGLKAVSWVRRQHAPSLAHGIGTPPGADINPTSRSPASQHQGLTGDSKDVCSLILYPMAGKAGLVQELCAQDLWHTAL